MSQIMLPRNDFVQVFIGHFFSLDLKSGVAMNKWNVIFYYLLLWIVGICGTDCEMETLCCEETFSVHMGHLRDMRASINKVYSLLR